ncbi:MAG: hypothetical protein LUF91_05670, partial [Oscillospiraceae bacterium]|nr:hypothetical protein [Oscillospiraceae bacterium]
RRYLSESDAFAGTQKRTGALTGSLAMLFCQDSLLNLLIFNHGQLNSYQDNPCRDIMLHRSVCFVILFGIWAKSGLKHFSTPCANHAKTQLHQRFQ